MRYGMKLGIYMAALAALCLTLLLFAISCKQQQTSSSTIGKPLPKGGRVAVSPEKPELLRSEKVGDDTRYVVAFEGQEFHIVAGEKGIFGIKIPAPANTPRWTSLWLDFYPVYPRQREHKIADLSAKAVSFDYVSGDFRGFVQQASKLAGLIAPQKPQVDSAAISPRAARLKLKGLDLSPIAANELAILGHTGDILVVVNETFPMRPLPGKVKEVGDMRFSGGMSEMGFSPNASWSRLKMGIKLYDVGLLAIKQQNGGITCYLEFLKVRENYRDLVALIKYEGGLINITRFDPVTPGKEKLIEDEYRTIAGMLLTVLDNQLFDPPQEFKTDLVAALTAINQKGTAQTFALKTKRSGGIEDILYMLGKPQEEAK